MSELRVPTRQRSIVMESSLIPARSARLQRARRVAALLAIVWTLPALLCAGNTLAHGFEHAPHEVLAVDEQLTSRTNEVNHDHGHRHPEPASLLPPERAEEFDARLLESTNPLVIPTHATLQCRAESAPGHADGLILAGSGPRAPPIS